MNGSDRFQQLRTILRAVYGGLEFLKTHQESGPSAFGALQAQLGIAEALVVLSTRAVPYSVLS